MAKLGWVVAGLMATALVVGAAVSREDADTKATLYRIERLLTADVHPRLFTHTYHSGFCDSETICRVLEKRQLMKPNPDNGKWIMAELEKVGGKDLVARYEKLLVESAQLDRPAQEKK